MSTTLVPVVRVSNGQPVDTELAAMYQDTGDGLPVLTISSDWRPRLNSWRKESTYRVEEVPTPLGRGFILYRSPEAIAADPGGDDAYQTLLANPQDTVCSCRGHLRYGYCAHVSALQALLAEGHIDHPEAGRPTCKRCGYSSSTPLRGELCDQCGEYLADRAAEEAAESSYQTDPERSGLAFTDAAPF